MDELEMHVSQENAASTSPRTENSKDEGQRAGRVVLLYTTFPSADAAKAAGRALVESGMAACVNIFPGITAIYIWEGKVEEGQEAAMIIKTGRQRAEHVLAELKRLHPYSLPARLVLSVEGGGADFLDWIVGQTGAPSGRP
jgi:periplasmic divalent cation tolerance protein